MKSSCFRDFVAIKTRLIIYLYLDFSQPLEGNSGACLAKRFGRQGWNVVVLSPQKQISSNPVLSARFSLTRLSANEAGSKNEPLQRGLYIAFFLYRTHVYKMFNGDPKTDIL